MILVKINFEGYHQLDMKLFRKLLKYIDFLINIVFNEIIKYGLHNQTK